MKFSTIEELSTVVRGSSPRPKGDPRYYGGNVPRLMVSDVSRDGMYVTPSIDTLTEEGAKKSRPMKKGELVVAVSGDPGEPSILKVNACIHDGFVGLRDLNEQKVYTPYLFRFFKFNKLINKSQAVGAIYKNLNTTQIKALKIPLPPLKDQKKIAAILDEADKLRQLDKQLIEKYDALTQSLFIDMFGDVRVNEKNFVEETIQNACVLVTDGAHRTPKLLDDGYPFLTVANMSETGYLYDNCKRISEVDYKDLIRNNCQPLKDDILFSKDGTVGKVMRIRKFEEVVILSSIALLRFKKDYNPVFVKHYLKTDFFLFQATSRKSGSAIRRIVLKDLKKTKIALPPIELQNQFSEKIQVIESQKTLAEQSLKKSEDLFNSLLQKAFNGELVK